MQPDPIFCSAGVSNHKTFLFPNIHRSSFRLHHFPRRPNSGGSTFFWPQTRIFEPRLGRRSQLCIFKVQKYWFPYFWATLCCLSGSAFDFWPRGLLGCQQWSNWDYHLDSKLKSPPNPVECPAIRRTTWHMPLTYHHHPPLLAAIIHISGAREVTYKYLMMSTKSLTIFYWQTCITLNPKEGARLQRRKNWLNASQSLPRRVVKITWKWIRLVSGCQFVSSQEG